MGALRPVIEGPMGVAGTDLEKKPRFCFQVCTCIIDSCIIILSSYCEIDCACLFAGGSTCLLAGGRTCLLAEH